MKWIIFFLVIFNYIAISLADEHSNHIHRHFEHDPRIPLRTVKCYECYETAQTKDAACSRTRYCEGKWCVKGPDSGGIYRGCMHLLPFKVQAARCYNVTGEDGRINENCYCNSRDFCNQASHYSIPLPAIITSMIFSYIFLWNG